MSAERWIEIPRWDEFQHYRDRNPTWIKNYTRLLRDDDYYGLTPAERGILHGLWLMRATHGGPLSATRARQELCSSPAAASQFRRNLEALNHAGFIRFLASRPLAPETESEKERSTTEKRQKPAIEKESFGNLNPEPLTEQQPSAWGLEGALLELLASLTDRDKNTRQVIESICRKHHLGEGALRGAREAARSSTARSPTKVAIGYLNQQARQNGAAQAERTHR